MTATISAANRPFLIDGKSFSQRIEISIREQVNGLRQGSPSRGAPGLGVILVGDNPASAAYVRGKELAAARCGFQTFDYRLPESASEGEIATVISSFNQRDEVDGILLQLPLPSHLNSSRLIELIDSQKDVDGLTALNQGGLMKGAGGLRPCTPTGCLVLIDYALHALNCAGGNQSPDAIDPLRLPKRDLSGMKAVVVGRSVLVGRPLALMLLERNATVTVVHSKTDTPSEITRNADIVIAAVGQPRLVDVTWIKPGAVVIDVGINRLKDGSLVGDVNFESASKVAGAITPVPKGVGPMTVAELMRNTLSAYKARRGLV